MWLSDLPQLTQGVPEFITQVCLTTLVCLVMLGIMGSEQIFILTQLCPIKGLGVVIVHEKYLIGGDTSLNSIKQMWKLRRRIVCLRSQSMGSPVSFPRASV